MQKRTLSLTLTLLLGASFALSGCGNGSDSSSSAATQGSSSPSATTSTNDKTTAGVVTIRTTLQPGELTDDQIKEFESENPNIKVELIPADDTKLMAMVASGNAPDVIRISGVQQLPTYVTRGLALNLDPYMKSSTLIKRMTCFR